MSYTGLYWAVLGSIGLYLDVSSAEMICIQKIYGFQGLKPLNYRGKLRCHACDIRTDGGKLKIGQCSGRPETEILYDGY